MRRLMAFVVLAGLGLLAAALPAQTRAPRWPSVAWPKEITPTAIGSELDINGLPLQLHAFVSSAPPFEVARWFRRSLGEPLLENRLDRQLVLGRMQGPYYLTVQLESAAGGTRGLLGVTALQTGIRGSPQAEAERWRAPWPAGSHLYSRVSSLDAGRRARHMVVVNHHAEALNAEHLKTVLAAEGYALEREAAPTASATHDRPEAPGRVLFFKGPGGDALATIHRDAEGRSVIVLNTTSHPERTP